VLHLWSSASYDFPLPAGHRFPIEKYALLRERVIAEGIVTPAQVHTPERATSDEVHLTHTADYVRRVNDGGLDDLAVRRLGFPWSSESR
jgi:acetoin utilization deacetylase AcuC-like enzyme